MKSPLALLIAVFLAGASAVAQQPGGPHAPSKLVTSPGNGAILLQWSAVPEATGYVVEYKSGSSSNWTAFATVPATQRGVTITRLSNNAGYDLRVRTAVAGGTSAPSATVSATPLSTTNFATDYHQTLSNGQSLSVGHAGGPPLSTKHVFGNLMLGPGLAALIPLVEPGPGAAGSVETMSSGLASELTELAADAAPNYTSIVSMHGVGAQAYGALKKGTGPYATGMAQLNAAFGLSTAAGKSFSVDAVTIVHGESDEVNGVSADTYVGYLLQWQADYQADVQAITGQTGTLPLFTNQMSSWTMYKHATPTTAIGQWTAGRDHPGKIYLVAPLYMLDHSDGVHLKNYSYRRLGEYFGKVMKQVLVDRKPWTPLSPKTVTRQGKVITAKFYVPVPPIAFDTTAVDKQANYGFEYYDAANSATITGVAITGPDTVQITLSNPPTAANGELRYAFTGTSGALAGAHSAGAPKGNVRDSDETKAHSRDSSVPVALGIYLRNWLVTFAQPITGQ